MVKTGYWQKWGNKMTDVLCFGDSNTWGYNPADGSRFPWEVRWTGRLQEALREDGIRILEEGLCGRTTIFEDPLRLGRKGTGLFPVLLETHGQPDVIVLMLGTNDCKTVFSASAEVIGKGVARLLEQAGQASPGSRVLVVSPIWLGERVWEEGFDPEFSPESVEVSKRLGAVYQRVAARYGAEFLRASDYVKCSQEDQEHMDAANHRIFAEVIADRIRQMTGTGR